MINFNEPIVIDKGLEYIREAVVKYKHITGDGVFTKKCANWFEEKCMFNSFLLTTSCTHALEMAALLCEIEQGDEVIMPAYTFVTTANAFVLRGAKIKFVDIRPDTMNIDEKVIENAITDRTMVIVPVHYAGVSCAMDEIMSIAKKNNLYVVEDAAQGVMSKYKGRYLGGIGDLGSFSFHETKNFSMGEGGALVIQNSHFLKRAEIIREKGTNRSRFIRGEVDKYSWVDKGSSYLPSDMNAAYLYAQLEIVEEINNKRHAIWNLYHELLKPLSDEGLIQMQYIPEECEHNAHMFYIKVRDLNERTRFLEYLKENGIYGVFHYIPLHTAEAGKMYGEFVGDDIFTTIESERLVRLPLFYGLSEKDVYYIVTKIGEFFKR